MDLRFFSLISALSTFRLQVFEQGTKVNLSSYYATCEARNYRVSQIQSGFAGKNKSNIHNGDNYYFSGKHMYETTQGEAYSRPAPQSAAERLSVDEEEAVRKERLRKYQVAKAVVGKVRIGQITNKIKYGLEARVSGGTGFRRRMFALFDKSGAQLVFAVECCPRPLPFTLTCCTFLTSSMFFLPGTGTVDPADFRLVCHDLGVAISEIEAIAVYGSADINGDGAMSFHEFLKAYMDEEAAGLEQGPSSPEAN